MTDSFLKRIDKELYELRAQLVAIWAGIWGGWLLIEPLPWRDFLSDFDPLSFFLKSAYRLAVPVFIVLFTVRSVELNPDPLRRIALWMTIGILWKVAALFIPAEFDYSAYPLICGLTGLFVFCRKASQRSAPAS